MRTVLATVLAATVLAGLSSCRRPTAPAAAPLDLIWADEFSGPAGALPDPTRWRFEVGTDWGNQQLEYDTARPENASLDGTGHLVITARQESYLGQPYTSARINTRGLFEQTRGRFEARIQLPIGRGIWPAFWLLGGNIGSVGWPACGEIDILEHRGQEPNKVWGSLHGPGYSGGAALTAPYTLPSGGFHEGFHVFAVDWNQERIVWEVDGIAYRTVRPSDLPAGGRWVFDHPFSIILNVAVGGNYVGSPDGSTVFPQSMRVDWVRVYRARP